jgi:broad specificity phosphatase PhoE
MSQFDIKETLIIRHARSLSNIRKVQSLDPALSDFGEQQATRVGKFLAKHLDMTGWSYVTSPFLRCLQTSDRIIKEINKVHGKSYGTCNFQVTDAVREYINHCGREVTIPVRRDEFPDMKWDGYEGHSHVYYKDEFNEEFLNRLHGFKSQMWGKTLIVTHGLPAFGLLHVIAHHTNMAPIWDHSLDNASITYIVNNRVVWHGRSLYHELDYDPFDISRPFDAADLLVPKA